MRGGRPYNCILTGVVVDEIFTVSINFALSWMWVFYIHLHQFQENAILAFCSDLIAAL